MHVHALEQSSVTSITNASTATPTPTCRPDPMKPVDRLSHRFSVTPVSSQRQSAGLGLILRPVSCCTRSLAYLRIFNRL